jgi:hypothetical protein
VSWFADLGAHQRWLWTVLVPTAIVATAANMWLGDWGLPLTFLCGVIAGKFAPAPAGRAAAP